MCLLNTSREIHSLAQIDETDHFWIALKKTILASIASKVLSLSSIFCSQSSTMRASTCLGSILCLIFIFIPHISCKICWLAYLSIARRSVSALNLEFVLAQSVNHYSKYTHFQPGTVLSNLFSLPLRIKFRRYSFILSSCPLE